MINDDIFTFIVGREGQRFSIHVNALRSISKPLGVVMDESVRKVAIFPSVDADAFGMLVMYAYKGLCGISDAYPRALTMSLPTSFRCHKCSDSVPEAHENSQQYPFCSGWCRTSYLSHFRHATMVSFNHKRYSHIYTLYCVADGTPIPLGCNSGHDLLCSPCTELGRGKYYPPYQNNLNRINVAVSKCSPEFSARRYGCTNTSHEELQEQIRRHLPKDSNKSLDGDPLLLHARLYNLAKQYMVPDLPEICLHKLHALLKVFKINEKSINKLIELVLFVYSNTPGGGNILHGSGDPMRDLVIRYVADRARDIMKYENFRQQAILGAGGAPGADLMAVTYGEAYS